MAAALALLSGGLAASPAAAGANQSSSQLDSSGAAGPALNVSVIQRGLDTPWEIAFIDATRYLVTERTGRLSLGRLSGGPLTPVKADLTDLASGDSGLMGMVTDPAFATNRIFYTCQSHVAPNDNRIIRWRLSATGTSAVRVGAPVLTGLPLGKFHTSCRLLFGPDGKIWASTGDSYRGRAAQDKTNLGGKILRVNKDGSVPSDNPWATATNIRQRYVWNYGHRNPQGLAWRPGTKQMWNAEHGPDWDDEVNLVLKGRNYGWNPVKNATDPAYYQNVPMTDLVEFPDAVPAKWSSGVPTVAPSGMTFIRGNAWGAYNGVAVLALLKDEGMLGLWLDKPGNVIKTAGIPELNDTYGRLRTPRMGPDGALYVLTSNGTDDKILRVAPSAS